MIFYIHVVVFVVAVIYCCYLLLLVGVICFVGIWLLVFVVCFNVMHCFRYRLLMYCIMYRKSPPQRFRRKKETPLQ